MGDEWQTLTLKEAGVSLIDCVHKTPPDAGVGYPYVAISQMKGGQIDLAGVRRISQRHFDEWTKKADPKGFDIILSRRCNPGTTAYVPPGFKFALGQNLVLLRADGEKVFPPFLRWLVCGPEWWGQISKFINVGAVFDSLRCADVPKFTLTIPSFADQKCIAAVLGALDDKIELNRKMNKTLEAMAQAIFKSWFIDFDWIRQNQPSPLTPLPKGEGNSGGMPNKSHLPPGEGLGEGDVVLVDSELGPIPKGWKVIPFSEIITIWSGGTPKRSNSDYWNGNIPWYTVKDVPTDGNVWCLDTAEKITNAGESNSAAKVMRAGISIVSARGTVGKLALIGTPMAMNQSCYGIEGKDGYPDLFTYFMLRKVVGDLKARSHGSVFDTITRDTFGIVKIVKPPVECAVEFELAVASLLEKLKSSCIESGTLVSLRDTLLPKLISGEVRVPEAKHDVEALCH